MEFYAETVTNIKAGIWNTKRKKYFQIQYLFFLIKKTQDRELTCIPAHREPQQLYTRYTISPIEVATICNFTRAQNRILLYIIKLIILSFEINVKHRVTRNQRKISWNYTIVKKWRNAKSWSQTFWEISFLIPFFLKPYNVFIEFISELCSIYTV